MLILALVLFSASTLFTLPLILSTKGPGPEGPVGFHMLTGPLALLQIAGIVILVHHGFWDLFPYARAVWDVSMVGYLVTMTILPALTFPREKSRTWAQMATIAILAAGLTLCGAAISGPVPAALRAVCGGVLALPALAGWLMIAAMVVQAQRNAIRKMEADMQADDEFRKGQIAFDAGEWAKLPADAGLWQMIIYTHSFNEDVQRECRARIAARPALQEDMIKLLGTGWAEHAIRYLRDAYPLPFAPLAPAFGAFLEKELERWRGQLEGQANAGTWGANISGHFEVAAKIVKDGGDLKAPLEKWRALLRASPGLGGLEWRVGEILEKKS
ncbi:MAG: hypothetical protein IT452_05155 [Planctomycetia bacterium]|nr:hypothetical protein [Planctomycetia bacterium]